MSAVYVREFLETEPVINVSDDVLAIKRSTMASPLRTLVMR